MGRLTSITSAQTLPALLRDVRAGMDVVATGQGPGAALLDAAAEALSGECRVIRVAAGPGPLSLSGLMAQIAGNADLSAQDDSVVELGYRRLAVPDAPGQRVALLVSDAGQLQRAALRFIQHIARTAPALVLVLVGGPELDAVLDEPDFAPLRARLPVAAVEPPPVVRERVSSVSSRTRRRSPVWAAGGLGLAASVALAAWAVRAPTRMEEPQAPLAVDQAQAAPVSAPVSAPISTPAPAPKHAETAAAPSQAAVAEPVKQAMFLPPVMPAPEPPPSPAAEPDRLRTPPRPPRQADARPKEQPAPASVRRAHASRPASRGLEPERGGYWPDETPRPAYGGPAPPPWATPGYDPWMTSPPPERPYIGTFTADRSGMRTFHPQGGRFGDNADYGRYEGGWR